MKPKKFANVEPQNTRQAVTGVALVTTTTRRMMMMQKT
jgi:hypothetical protein